MFSDVFSFVFCFSCHSRKPSLIHKISLPKRQSTNAFRRVNSTSFRVVSLSLFFLFCKADSLLFSSRNWPNEFRKSKKHHNNNNLSKQIWVNSMSVPVEYAVSMASHCGISPLTHITIPYMIHISIMIWFGWTWAG